VVPQVVLITGCSSGIGRATALRLAKADHTVYATARRLESVKDLEDHGCRTLSLDVTDQASAAAAVAAVEDAHGSVDALVNNAGYGQSGAVEAVPIDDIRRQFETNVLGYIRMAQLVLPAMRRVGRGRIVNLSSVAGRVVMPGSGIYSSSKFAIEAFSDALRYEVRGFGIDVVVVEPGPIRTSFTGTANDGFPDAAAGYPYGDFHEAVAASDAEADHSKLAGDADEVAAVIQNAVEARHPKPRYRVKFVARFLPALRAALPDRAWDAFLRTQVPPPKAE
jgi:NAD(P)-dependent dehydrogenase (short-subunit alcohol dehydrogenase family)